MEQYVVVGDRSEARQAAELWRFGPKAFKGYYDIPDPARVQQRADAELPIDEVIQGWPIDTDPKVHIEKIHELFDSGVTIVNIHFGQRDQRKVVAFYGEHVLP